MIDGMALSGLSHNDKGGRGGGSLVLADERSGALDWAPSGSSARPSNFGGMSGEGSSLTWGDVGNLHVVPVRGRPVQSVSARHRGCAEQTARLKRSSIVTGVEKGSTTKSGLSGRLRRLADVGAGTVGLTLATAITSMVVLSPRPVGADQISSLQAEAAHISQELVEEQLQIGGFEQQYAVDAVRVQRDEEAIGQTEDAIEAAACKIERDRDRLRTEALTVYTSDGAADPGGTLAIFDTNEKTEASTVEYEQLASGDIDTTMAQLHTDQNRLRADEVLLDQQEAEDQSATNEEATLAADARQTQAQLESQQSEVNGALAAAVAQQEAAQAAAAAAAVRAAQASSASPGLNSFLQCVVEAESSGNYSAISPGGEYMGAFQFSQATWNEAAELAGMPQLIGVPPNEASPAEQNALAIALYNADGEQPWYDPCRGS